MKPAHRIASHLRRLLRPGALLGALSLAATSWSAPPDANEATLRIALASARGEPYVELREGRPGGLDWELGQAVADVLQARPVAVSLPLLRLRSAAAAGEFDLVCGLDPARHVEATELSWGPLLVEGHEFLVAHRGVPPLLGLEGLPAGSTLGLVLGQRYPELEEFLQRLKLEREDALTEERLLRKLIAQRHPYAVLSLPVLRRGPSAGPSAADGLASWSVPVARPAYHCAVPRRGTWPAERIWKALSLVQQAGRTRALEREVAPPIWVVAVASASPLKELDRTEFSDYLLGYRTRLSNGLAPPVLLPTGSEQQRFLREGMGQSPAEAQARWSGQQFGGRGRAPSALDAKALRDRLRQDPGLLGVLPLPLLGPGLRVLLIP